MFLMDRHYEVHGQYAQIDWHECLWHGHSKMYCDWSSLFSLVDDKYEKEDFIQNYVYQL